MKAFHNKIKIKNMYLDRIDAHFKADEIIKGQYWEGGKGCAVGCTIHGSEHKKYETELGIPRALARLEDTIFEGLPNDIAKTWPADFLKAVPVGADLSKVVWKFLSWVLLEIPSDKMKPEVKEILIEVSKFLKPIGRGKSIDIETAKELKDKAWSIRTAAYADDAADAAADAAAYAADAAAYAADAADAAAAAADAAAYAADAAAYADDAREQFYIKMADKLIKLIKASK